MEEINIKDYFIYLKKYIFAFVAMIVLAVSGVLVYDLGIKKPVYQAKTTVVIAKSDSTNNAAATLNDINASQKLTSTYSEIAKSELVLNKVIENKKLSMSAKDLLKNVTVKPVEDTSILSISVKDLEPAKSAEIANELATVFMDEISHIYKLDNVSQLSIAAVPDAPANNTTTRDIILALAIAIFGVAGIAFLRFYFDDTVKHSDEIEKTIGLPIAGNVIKSDIKDKTPTSEIVVRDYPKAIVSENIKSLRTNLQFTAVDSDIKTILVTSTNAGEGKSFVSANLAMSFAQADKRVLVVDCDLRKGRVHKVFDLPNKFGLSNLLTDNIKNLDKYIQGTPMHNLDVITCGTYPPNPSELLASKKNKKVIDALRVLYDIVVFDGAPIGGLADSVILSSFMDETLIVTRDGATSKNDLIATKEALEKVGAKVAGIVFNAVDRKSSSKYYNYYYSSESKK